MTTTLADIIRTYRQTDMTRNQLKVARARLRRAGVTNLRQDITGPYTVNPTSDAITDARADMGTIVAQVAADAARS